MLVLATAVFGLSFFLYGALLVPYLLVLFLFGIALGIIACGIVLRLGPASEWFIWPIPALISPFAGVFYPLSTLPHWMRVSFTPVAAFLRIREHAEHRAETAGIALRAALGRRARRDVSPARELVLSRHLSSRRAHRPDRALQRRKPQLGQPCGARPRLRAPFAFRVHRVSATARLLASSKQRCVFQTWRAASSHSICSPPGSFATRPGY